MENSALVVDACSLINLHATEQEGVLLTSIRVKLVTTPRAASEVLYRYGPLDEEGQRTKIPINLDVLTRVGLLDVRDLDPDMADLLVTAVSAGLRDADATVVALAQGLSLPLLSDDNKVRKVSARLKPVAPLESTLGILRRATEALGYSRDQIVALIQQLRYSGNFIAPKTDAHVGWSEGL
ncbi:MAG: hypothetical protein EXR72_10365 [Myxococcales bacterium]|nr:hypothetical protein [Myxococcales bacterium]